MASTAPTKPLARRAASQPIQRPASSPESQIETLYSHPSARIISFTTRSPTSQPSPSSGSPRVEEEPGTLPWISRSERTIAVGPLSIYRAPGSVAFLNCSHALRAILPKSQCWEVDGSGKFVLQIRPPQYWRIELPSANDDEQARVGELKDVLGRVLLFEKTPCPFKRNFTVELPEPPLTPVKKRPWRPVEKPKLVIEPTPEHRESSGSTSQEIPKEISWPSTPTTDTARTRSPSPSHDSRPSTATTHSTEDDDLLKRENESNISPTIFHGCVNTTKEDRISHSEIPSSAPSDVTHDGWTTFEEDGESFSDATDDTNMTPKGPLPPLPTKSAIYDPETRSRPQAMQTCSRSITAPPVLSLVTSRGSKPRTSSPPRSKINADVDSSFSSSVESFHSVQSWHSPLNSPSPLTSEFSSATPTYPYPHDNIVLPKRREDNTSEAPITPDTPHLWETTSADSDSFQIGSSPPPQTPTLVNDANEKSDEEQVEAVTPPTIRSKVRQHALTAGTSRRRGLSPLPAAVNLFSPPRQRLGSLQTAKHIPTAIIQKTCEILLSPPSHLFQLMLNIASKIAVGEWRGVLPGQVEAVHWDFEDEYGATEWTEDDYGISLFTAQDKARKESIDHQGGSWEVD